MILFFRTPSQTVYAVDSAQMPDASDLRKLSWLFGSATPLEGKQVEGNYLGPRREMISPWSTNAVEITQNMGIEGIRRIELFEALPTEASEAGDWAYDPMLQSIYSGLGQDIFKLPRQAEAIAYVDDVAAYNRREGLALSDEEIDYLNEISRKIGRPLTDSEVFGFSQVNSEHCRHKIFNGTFVIDGKEREQSLFQLIKRTSAENPNQLVSAYKDNVAFNAGPDIEEFAPASGEEASFFRQRKASSVLSLKAETHNFPTTVEAFNGAATGTGGEIRDRLGGGKASLPLAGTAVYMTAYPRTHALMQADATGKAKNTKLRPWEAGIAPRNWLYQTPQQILIKAA